VTKAHLSACPSCERHVRVSEGACPFCSADLTKAFAGKVAPRGPGVRLGRAALYAFGTGTLAAGTLAVAACSSTSAQPLYGAPFVEDAGQDGSIQVSPAYGGATPFDANGITLDAAYGGPALDADEPIDANEPDAQGVTPAYGAPAGDH
jgi:hypothetical protein